MSRLVSNQVSKKKASKFVCDFCLCSFGRQDLLDKHVEYCWEHDAVKTVMPEPGKSDILKFKNIQHQVVVPIKISCDFESFTKPIDVTHGETKLYQQHVPSAFCIYVVSRIEGFSMDSITYVCQGENDEVNKVFVRKLEEVMKRIYETFKVPVLMIYNEPAKKLHNSQNKCYACGMGFNEKVFKYKKVRDHCHFTGKYR